MTLMELVPQFEGMRVFVTSSVCSLSNDQSELRAFAEAVQSFTQSARMLRDERIRITIRTLRPKPGGICAFAFKKHIEPSCTRSRYRPPRSYRLARSSLCSRSC